MRSKTEYSELTRWFKVTDGYYYLCIYLYTSNILQSFYNVFRWLIKITKILFRKYWENIIIDFKLEMIKVNQWYYI